jgi:hypothetical protein
MNDSLVLRWKKISGRMNGREFNMIVDPMETDVEKLRHELQIDGGAEDLCICDMKPF